MSSPTFWRRPSHSPSPRRTSAASGRPRRNSLWRPFVGLLGEMNGPRRSIPFSITLLTLMMLIVLPLAAALLWLGWRPVAQLETRCVAQRLAPLEKGGDTFLTPRPRRLVAVRTPRA